MNENKKYIRNLYSVHSKRVFYDVYWFTGTKFSLPKIAI